MEKFVIEGGEKLSGKVRINGAKNSILPILAGSLLSSGKVKIEDVPHISDVKVMLGILECLGVKINWKGSSLELDAHSLSTSEIPEELMCEMRSSIFLMGPLLGKLGKVKVSYPGGCAIGPRPIDLHLKGLISMGVKVIEENGYVCAEVGSLKGSTIHLDFPSVGATENLMMAAIYAEGSTRLHNVAKEPEIVDLQNFLNKMGARVRGAGTDVITIDGVKSLEGAVHRLIPDRIIAGTMIAAAGITRGEVVIENVIPEHLEAVISKLREAGLEILEDTDSLLVRGGRIKGVNSVRTLPYPGFPTDMQPQIMALLSNGEGLSVIKENVFEGRFSHIDELNKMGAQITVQGRSAIIKGIKRFTGANVKAPDLRAGAALVLAGLSAQGTTVVDEVHYIDRGYDKLELMLQKLGANIKRVQAPVINV
ncbi:MAG: UDP-N-acetylglucosamine 1-carboxyvinyltransferase [Candidatus Syntrophonatronum acetioxidans]|uniref:UDP-N-acetylglucosamine 1-carboxyvinyltransferase n=1 Tax=Candidatus Syntrophonatronum acetioxidans TaxID=1795816 RepID=A0A424YBA5_9FIRM|nr:MAG: UDP-N-acetylglucosamine 1-carboxyvinyltransferase [Candidatus Syntrophonatronum acetioxidans]